MNVKNKSSKPASNFSNIRIHKDVRRDIDQLAAMIALERGLPSPSIQNTIAEAIKFYREFKVKNGQDSI